MKCGLDSIFKVGFGVELNCLEGSNQEGNAFIKAFDDSNALVYWRYVDQSIGIIEGFDECISFLV